MRRFFAALLQHDTDPKLLDHVSVGGDGQIEDIARVHRDRVHAAKLMDARQRYGKAFVCAGANQDREVMVAPGVVRTVWAGASPTRKEVLTAGDLEYGSWAVQEFGENVARLRSRGAR